MDNTEKIFLILVFSVSSLMLLGSWQYTPKARIFPQISAIITLLFSIFVGAQNVGLGNIGSGSDLASSVQGRVSTGNTKSESESSDNPDENIAEFSKADPGEFRISQPTTAWNMPFFDRSVSKRIVLSGLLLGYLFFLWLLGIAIASIIFVIGYSYILNIRKNISTILLLFTIATLFVFERWFVTPMFRPGHEMFSVVEVLPL